MGAAGSTLSPDKRSALSEETRAALEALPPKAKREITTLAEMREIITPSTSRSPSPQSRSPGMERRSWKERFRMSVSPEMGVNRRKETLPFPHEYVGTFSCHGVEPCPPFGEVCAKVNQDRGCVVYPYGPDSSEYEQALFCVYDGHGALGHRVSQFAMIKLQEKLEAHPTLYSDPPTALKETFVAVDEELKLDRKVDAELSGTSATVILYRSPVSDPTKVEMWSACCGDSRAVLCEKAGAEAESALKGATAKDLFASLTAKDITEDQKPDLPAEAARIRQSGGFVSPPPDDGFGGPARVWMDADFTKVGLAMARSIGDHRVATVGVIAEPVVEAHTLTLPADDESDGSYFLVIASDGVWEFIESVSACALVKKFLLAPDQPQPDATLAVSRLIETAAAKWNQEMGDYRDDITAIVVRMRGLFEKGNKGV